MLSHRLMITPVPSHCKVVRYAPLARLLTGSGSGGSARSAPLARFLTGPLPCTLTAERRPRPVCPGRRGHRQEGWPAQRSCLIKAAPNVMPPRLFPNEPTHVLFEVLKLEPGASLDLNADVLGGGGSGGSTGSGSDAGSGSSGSTLLYATSLSLDSAVRVPGEAFAVLHAMAVVGGLLSGDSALHRGPDGTRHAQQPDTRQVWYSSLGHFLS